MIKSKRYFKEIVFILLVAFILCIPFLFWDLHGGHDGVFHIGRLVGICEGFKDGQVIPRIYPEFNNNFGYGTPLFYCDLFLYPFAILYYFGVPLIISFKLMLIFYTLLSVVIVFVVLKRMFKNSDAAVFIGTILYSFANYHIMDLHVRLALGEIFAITFIPLVIYAIYSILVENKNAWFLLGISFSLLLFSHNLSFALYCVLFAVLLIIYFIYNLKTKKKLKTFLTVFKGTILAILLSSWFLLPMLEQTLSQDFLFQGYGRYYDLSSSITPLKELINPLNIIIKNGGSFADNVGPGISLLTLFVICFFIRKIDYIKVLLFISLVLLLMVTGIIPIYRYNSVFGILQFVFRLYILIFPLLVIIAAYVISHIKKKWLLIALTIFIILTSAISIISCYRNYYFNASISYYTNDTSEEDLFADKLFVDDGYNYGQMMAKDYLPAGMELDYYAYPRHIREMLDEYTYNEIIYDYEITEEGSAMSFAYDFVDDKLLMLPKTYYKGYQVFLTEGPEWIKLDTINLPNYRLVGFVAPSGQHSVLLKYSGTLIQKISPFVSVGSLLGTIVYLLYREKKDAKFK